jgi:hypothetical protein
MTGKGVGTYIVAQSRRGTLGGLIYHESGGDDIARRLGVRMRRRE